MNFTNRLIQYPLGHQENDKEEFSEYTNIELFKIIQEMKKELLFIQLENVTLEEFLQKTDPKLLIGVTKALELIQRPHKIQFEENQKDDDGNNLNRILDKSNISFSSSRTGTSLTRRGGASVKTFESFRTNLEIRLNYVTKIDLTEQLSQEIQQKCNSKNNDTEQKIKNLNANIIELKLENDEIQKTIESFENFVLLQDVDSITKISSEKYCKNFEEWIKNGMALVRTTHLKITALKQQCLNQKSLLLKKANLSGILRPIDFEQLKMENNEYISVMNDKNSYLIGLKYLNGNAALILTLQKKNLNQIENYFKKLMQKTNEMKNDIQKLKNETKFVEENNEIYKKKSRKCTVSNRKILCSINNELYHTKTAFVNIRKRNESIESTNLFNKY